MRPKQFFRPGARGVMILPGYSIHHSYRINPRGFYLRRLERLLPVFCRLLSHVPDAPGGWRDQRSIDQGQRFVRCPIFHAKRRAWLFGSLAAWNSWRMERGAKVDGRRRKTLRLALGKVRCGRIVERGGRKAKVRGRRSEVRGQRPEVRGQ
jgi:hypothetical protein